MNYFNPHEGKTLGSQVDHHRHGRPADDLDHGRGKGCIYGFYGIDRDGCGICEPGSQTVVGMTRATAEYVIDGRCGANDLGGNGVDEHVSISGHNNGAHDRVNTYATDDYEIDGHEDVDNDKDATTLCYGNACKGYRVDRAHCSTADTGSRFGHIMSSTRQHDEEGVKVHGTAHLLSLRGGGGDKRDDDSHRHKPRDETGLVPGGGVIPFLDSDDEYMAWESAVVSRRHAEIEILGDHSGATGGDDLASDDYCSVGGFPPPLITGTRDGRQVTVCTV